MCVCVRQILESLSCLPGRHTGRGSRKAVLGSVRPSPSHSVCLQGKIISA